MDAGWQRALEPVADHLIALLAELSAERAAGTEILPAEPAVLRAFDAPFADVRVVILGQDPYPTPGHAAGLAFSVPAEVTPLPPSVRNLLTEYQDDLGLRRPSNGDLSRWSNAGVFLLNRTLTVRAGEPGSHAQRGWDVITRHAVRSLVSRGTPLVGVLWGAHAHALRLEFGSFPVLMSPHPSPLAAYRGFFGSKPFSRANQLLVDQGGSPVDWSLT